MTAHLTHRLLFGLKADAFEIPQKSELRLRASCWKGWMFAWVAFSKMANVLSKLHTASNIFLKSCIWYTVNYQQRKKHTILNLLKLGWERSQTLGGSCVLSLLSPALFPLPCVQTERRDLNLFAEKSESLSRFCFANITMNLFCLLKWIL